MREHRTAEHDRLLESLTTDEWTSLGALAIRQRVAPLLTFGSLPLMPVATRQTLEAHARASAIRVLRYQAEFVQLARALEPHGVPLLILKGLHLASSVYPHATMREMNDFDVLVRPEHLDVASAAVRELGYVPVHEVSALPVSRVTHHLPRFIKPAVGIEIHWRIAPEGKPPLADPPDLWERAEPNALAHNAFQLCPEDALLHICAHATVSHLFDQGVRPLCDIRALVAKHGHRIEWEAVAARAFEWRCERGVALALHLADRLLGVEIPQLAFDRLASAHLSPEVVSLAAAQLFDKNVLPEFGEAAGRLMALRSVPARVRHTWGSVFLPPTQLAVMYPSAQGKPVTRALLPLRRLWDLTRRYSWDLVRLAMNRGSEERKFIDRRNALAEWLRK